MDSDSDPNPDSGFLVLITPLLFFHGQLDSNPDSDSKQLDSDSRKNGWIRILLDSDSRCLDLDSGCLDLDSGCLDSHITDIYHTCTYILRFVQVELADVKDRQCFRDRRQKKNDSI